MMWGIVYLYICIYTHTITDIDTDTHFSWTSASGAWARGRAAKCCGFDFNVEINKKVVSNKKNNKKKIPK